MMTLHDNSWFASSNWTATFSTKCNSWLASQLRVQLTVLGLLSKLGGPESPESRSCCWIVDVNFDCKNTIEIIQYKYRIYFPENGTLMTYHNMTSKKTYKKTICCVFEICPVWVCLKIGAHNPAVFLQMDHWVSFKGIQVWGIESFGEWFQGENLSQSTDIPNWHQRFHHVAPKNSWTLSAEQTVLISWTPKDR